MDPFIRILAQLSLVSFTLQLPNDTWLHDTYHVSKLKLTPIHALCKYMQVLLQAHSSTSQAPPSTFQAHQFIASRIW